VQRAIEVGVDFLLSRDPAVADYPYTERVNTSWFKFGFPLSYLSDVPDTVSVLVAPGYGRDPRPANVRQLILSMQDSRGRCPLFISGAARRFRADRERIFSRLELRIWPTQTKRFTV
jgi:hypothetical protein